MSVTVIGDKDWNVEKKMKTGIITRELVQTMIGKRRREIHKGDCGRILIAAGSKGMAGAAILAARAALRTGSGLVQLAIPAEIFPIVQTAVPEATCLERDFSKTGSAACASGAIDSDAIGSEAGAKIDLGRYDAAAIGPGLGESEESVAAVRFMIENFDGPLVLDADALNIIARNDFFALLRSRAPLTTVLTPHLGEAGRLLGESLREPAAEEGRQAWREEIAARLADETGACLVLKGWGTIVAFAGSLSGTGAEMSAYTNTTGNPGMATAGSGDVLTGIITSLAGQKLTAGRKPAAGRGAESFGERPAGGLTEAARRLSAAEAAVCGTFIHGLAGDLAAESTGEYGLIAGDLAYYAALALKDISG